MSLQTATNSRKKHMTNHQRTEQYCSYFEEQLKQIQKLNDRLHKKVLLLVILDTLSRVRYPDTKGNKDRFITLVKDHIQWPDSSRVSLNQILLLSPSTNLSELTKFSRVSVGEWKEWEWPTISVDPFINEIEHLVATAEETKLLHESTHLNLLYAYRNHLIHEFREPGNGMETGQSKPSPHYRPMTHIQPDEQKTSESWELIYPLGFFVTLAMSCLKNLKQYL